MRQKLKLLAEMKLHSVVNSVLVLSIILIGLEEI